MLNAAASRLAAAVIHRNTGACGATMPGPVIMASAATSTTKGLIRMTAHQHLDRAAGLLLTVGRAPLGDVDVGAALSCLHARALLCDAGAATAATPTTPAANHAEARTAVRAALAELAQLPAAIFGRRPVLDAAHACHQALRDLA
jgi:hypothetical protein